MRVQNGARPLEASRLAQLTRSASDNTKGCYDVIKAASTLVLSSLDSMDIDKSKPLVIADYGSAWRQAAPSGPC